MLFLLLATFARTDELAIIDRLRSELQATFETEVRTLIARVEDAGDNELAAELRPLLDPPEAADPLDRRPKAIGTVPLGLPEDRRRLHLRARELRRDHAAAIFRLARRANKAGHPATAFRMLEAAVRVDPDYEPVRRLLGDQRVGDEWMTPFEAMMKRKHLSWHNRFGWLPPGHAERYEAGERFFRNRWMTADEEQTLRRKTPRGWEIETDHFVITSNYSLERAANLAGRLEGFHRFFRRTYTDLFDSPRLAGALLESGTIPKKDKHKIRDFATQEEYVRTLTPKLPGVEVSLGVYLTGDRTAYFFYRDPASESGSTRPEETLYHEVSHQLISEADPAVHMPGSYGGYWASEGFACYLESFDPSGDPRVGDIDHSRVEAAREQFLSADSYEPFAKFEALSTRAFQRGETLDVIVARYNQAAGLTHFFLNAHDGRYRDAFLQYVRELYDIRKTSPTPLTRLTGQTGEQIDGEYKAYLRELDGRSKWPVLRENRGPAKQD